jgi:hypothetical protein
MTLPPPRDMLLRIQKLVGLPAEIRQSQWGVEITRLTVLKSLCQQPELANRFVLHLARKTFEHLGLNKNRTAPSDRPIELSHRRMMEEALEGMASWQRNPTEQLRRSLSDLHGRMRAEQNEHRKIPFGHVRLITDSKLLIFEYALSCHLADEQSVGTLVYRTASHYAERYDSSHGTGLIPTSIPFVQDIIDFWMSEYTMTLESLAPAPKAMKSRPKETPITKSNSKRKSEKDANFTARQGQFLAFIHLYQKLHRRAPAELDLRKFFLISPPSVHSMIVKLDELGLITREAGVARSMRITVPVEQIPELEEVAGPPW